MPEAGLAGYYACRATCRRHTARNGKRLLTRPRSLRSGPGDLGTTGLATGLATVTVERLRASTVCFQAGHIRSWRGSCECYALSPVAAACRWSLLLLSPLLSTRRRSSGSKPTRTLQGMARVRSGHAAAWPLASDRSVRRGSRVKRDFACTFTRYFYLCPLSCGHSRAWGWRGGHVHSAGHPRI
jgi:hypothetical protein